MTIRIDGSVLLKLIVLLFASVLAANRLAYSWD